jgi:hypothetical protein
MLNILIALTCTFIVTLYSVQNFFGISILSYGSVKKKLGTRSIQCQLGITLLLEPLCLKNCPTKSKV